MEGFFLLLIIGAIICYIYQAGHKSGKREGSRKGFGAGYNRGKHSRGKSGKGCLALFLAIAIPAALFMLRLSH